MLRHAAQRYAVLVLVLVVTLLMCCALLCCADVCVLQEYFSRIMKKLKEVGATADRTNFYV